MPKYILLIEDDPDILELLDLILECEGYQTISSNGEPTRTLPIIMISAEAELAHIAASCGADSYLSKPFDVDELLKKVKHFSNIADIN